MSDLFDQLDSYGAQLEASIEPYELPGPQQRRTETNAPNEGGEKGDRSEGTGVSWTRIFGVAASLVLVAGLILWSQRSDEDSQIIDVIDQPQVPTIISAPESGDPVPPPDETVAEANRPPDPADTCTELHPALAGLVAARPAMRVSIGDIESEVGALPAEIAAGTYQSGALGVDLQFSHEECVTLIEENPGMLTFVPAGENFEARAPWLSVLVPSAVSRTGGPSFVEAVATPSSIGEWASGVDAISATRLGEVNVGGIRGAEWLLAVNVASPDAFACSTGSCASVVRPHSTWSGTFFRSTLGHRPAFLHVGTHSQTRVIELMVGETPVWIWREAPPDDDDFFTKSDDWLDGWSLQPAGAVDGRGAFGATEIGSLTVASGATVSIPADGWSVFMNLNLGAVLVPPQSASVETPTHVVHVLRGTDDSLNPVSAEEALDLFRGYQDGFGWQVSDPEPEVLGDYVSQVITIEQNGGGGWFWPMPYSRLHIVESGASSWFVLVGGPDEAEVLALERAASSLLVGAELPDLGALDAD